MSVKKGMVLAIAFLVLFVAGCSGGGRQTSDQGAAQNNKAAIEDCITDSLDEETVKVVSSVTVIETSAGMSVSIRVVAAGGFYFPEVIEQTAEPVFEKAEELGVVITKYEVSEYSKNNAGEITDMIAWNSKDGVTGTYSDDTGSEPYIKTGATVDDIREMVK